jgi:energy-coupling factor transporter ATP-binding protein EcfA2
MQIASLFDVPLDQKLSMSWNVDLPVEDRSWNLGLIVGPSGAGKSSVARHLWPGQFSEHTWSEHGALVDDFADGLPIKTIQMALTGAGLGTISAWVRPHGTLSGGERFRADLARVIAETPVGEVAVIDEFTSVVDRTVAKAASHALQKAARRGGLRIVALSCHSDVEPWLNPDWVLELPDGKFQWRCLRPHPPLDFEIRQVPRRIWPRYAPFHYLSSHLPTSATCFGTFLNDECVCFTACTQRVHPSPKARLIWQAARQVTLPDYQGLGIATYTEDWLAAYYCAQGFRFRSLTSHPGAIAYYEKSPEWRLVHRGDAHQLKSGGRSNNGFRAHQAQLRMLGVQCWEFIPSRSARQPDLGPRVRAGG